MYCSINDALDIPSVVDNAYDICIYFSNLPKRSKNFPTFLDMTCLFLLAGMLSMALEEEL